MHTLQSNVGAIISHLSDQVIPNGDKDFTWDRRNVDGAKQQRNYREFTRTIEKRRDERIYQMQLERVEAEIAALRQRCQAHGVNLIPDSL